MARKTTPKIRRPKLAIEDVDALAIPKALVAVVEALTSSAPESSEPRSHDPRKRAGELARVAAVKAAAISGSLSLPPGPIGLLTAVPELLAIWKLQNQLVNDIAAAFGEHAPVQQEKMVYCLFKNMACQVARDVTVRVAERAIVRRASASLVRRVFWRCGVPIIGAAGAAAYAWFDTMQVAKRAVTLFEQQLMQRQTQSCKRVRRTKTPTKQIENIVAFDVHETRPLPRRRKAAKPRAPRLGARRLRPAA
ncbi:hypothetical protein ACXR0O_06835 [Verrucomicrobiota bacterium sgz303538]